MFRRMCRIFLLLGLMALLSGVVGEMSAGENTAVAQDSPTAPGAGEAVASIGGPICGFTYDAQTGELIFFGIDGSQVTSMDAAYLRDNSVVAIRSALDSAPGVSLEPIPGETEFQQMMYFPESMADTHFGDVLAEADIALKNLSLGRDNETDAPLNISVPGYQSVVERLAAANWDPADPNVSWRMFFELQATLVLAPDKSAGFIPADVITVDWAFDTGSDAVVATAVQAFIDHLNANYDAYAAEFAAMGNTSLEEIVELGKVMAMANWLQDQNIPLPLGGAFYTPTFVDSPDMVPIIEVPVTATSVAELVADTTTTTGPFYLATEPAAEKIGEAGGAIVLVGGVDFSLPPQYEEDSGVVATVSADALASRGGADTWNFESVNLHEEGRPGGTDGVGTVTYTAVALSLEGALAQNMLPFVTSPPEPANWQINNSVGGSLLATLNGVGTHTFPSGTSTWSGIQPGTYSYTLRAQGGPCNGAVLTGTHTFTSGGTIVQDVSCGPAPALAGLSVLQEGAE